VDKSTVVVEQLWLSINYRCVERSGRVKVRPRVSPQVVDEQHQ